MYGERQVSSARGTAGPSSRAARAALITSRGETCRAMVMPFPGLSRSERPPAPPVRIPDPGTYQQTLATVEGYLGRDCLSERHSRTQGPRRPENMDASIQLDVSVRAGRLHASSLESPALPSRRGGRRGRFSAPGTSSDRPRRRPASASPPAERAALPREKNGARRRRKRSSAATFRFQVAPAGAREARLLRTGRWRDGAPEALPGRARRRDRAQPPGLHDGRRAVRPDGAHDRAALEGRWAGARDGYARGARAAVQPRATHAR